MALVWIIAILFCVTNSYHPKPHTGKCIHREMTNKEHVQNALRYKNHPYEHKLSQSRPKFPSKRRLQLTDAQADPIRISVYFDPVTISTTAGLSTDQIDYIKRITAGAVSFFEKWVQVIPVEEPLTYFGCSSRWNDNGVDPATDPNLLLRCITYDLTCGQTTGTLSQCI